MKQLQLLVLIAMICLWNKLFKWVNQVIFAMLRRPNSNMYTLVEDVIKYKNSMDEWKNYHKSIPTSKLKISLESKTLIKLHCLHYK
jgi:hypothetical protein